MHSRKRVLFLPMVAMLALLLLSACGPDSVNVEPEAAEILFSETGSQSANTLEGRMVSGTVTIHLANEEGIRQVSFFLNDTEQSGAPIHVEHAAPFTFELDTTELANGAHNLTVVALTDPESNVWVVANSSFMVSNRQVAPSNEAPVVDAGADQTIRLPAEAELQGQASDDGRPTGQLTYSWSKKSGPGTVTFGSPKEATTIAAFSAPGSYVLELAVSDGELDARDTVTIEVRAEVSGSPDPDPVPGGHWRPAPGLTWYWQLSGPIDMNRDVDVYDIDYLTPASVVAELQAKGKKVIAYVPVGDWEDYRPDSDEFPADALCGRIAGWPERYIDIRNPKAVALIKDRITLAASKGFDGIEGDVVDLHLVQTGCSSRITEAEMTAFLRELTDHAHGLGLAYFAKNVTENAADWSTFVDGVVAEEGYLYGDAAGYMPYIQAGKPVFAVEYGSDKPTEAQCKDANQRGYALYGTNLSLTGAVYKTCW